MQIEMDLKKKTMCEMFVKRGMPNNKNNSSHFSRIKSRWIETKLSPTRKIGRFTINKGQSTKGKPSSNDTCFSCKKRGHWKNVMN
jgi:hypothetical protein